MALQIFMQSNCVGKTPRTSWRRTRATKLRSDADQNTKKGRDKRSPSLCEDISVWETPCHG